MFKIMILYFIISWTWDNISGVTSPQAGRILFFFSYYGCRWHHSIFYRAPDKEI